MHRCAVHEHFTRLGREHACENVEQGTLAAAGRADQRDEFPVLYIHAQVFRNSLLFERDADILICDFMVIVPYLINWLVYCSLAGMVWSIRPYSYINSV